MIFYHIDNTKFKFPYGFKKRCSDWINKTVIKENSQLGTINIIVTSDELLLEKNIEYLNHNFYTDIITFDYSSKDKIFGDLFISYDRVVENAKQYENVTIDELKRVIIHGILHLLGYKDQTPPEKAIMTQKENFYLKLF
ncbi:MAG: rRNA maturation RNase YbeY [Salinivirgaceae bacterium]|jgi:rRNA maturation RNase YbeY